MNDIKKKRCSSCKRTLSVSSFYRQKQKKDGLYSQCKNCHKMHVNEWAARNGTTIAKYAKVWRQNNKQSCDASTRKSRLKKTYGISIEEYEQKIKMAGSRCEICKKKTANPNLDHCHKTKLIRGILCFSCNVGIGHLRDDPKLLIAALAYLKKHSPTTAKSVG